MTQLWRFATVGTLAVLTAVGWQASAQYGVKDGQWPNYSGDKGSTKYSALDQINAGNVSNLAVAWKWESPDNAIAAENPSKRAGGYKSTPLVLNGVMYTSTTYNLAAAIDAGTGETLWTFDPKVWEGRRPGNLGFNSRGVAYWSDGAGDDRILLGTQANYLYALDAKTGKPVSSFGDDGVVDLNEPYRREVNRAAVWAISPVIVVGDTIVVGRAINDGPTTKEMPPGDVMAFDARTGKHKWTFHNPPLKGETGYDSWKEGSGDYTGNSNVWTHMSADLDLGLVYLPFGTPTNDWYGGHRKGNNLFAESIVAVNAETGKMAWYFQHVHHGLWDYDIPTAPALVDITVDGKAIKALAQMTKQGFLWVLDRTNGKPVWPVEERAVPQSSVPGEETSPTQPFPTKPAPYDQQGSTEAQLIDYTPELKAKAIEILKKYNHGPLYTPPMVGKPTINNPGWGGGGNWTGVSIDPETGWVYIPSGSGAAMSLTLVAPDKARSNLNYVGQPGGVDSPEPGLNLFKGPYSRITAIDLNTGDHVWQIPLGDGPINHPALKDLDLPPLGGRSRGMPLLTKSMLVITNGSGFRRRGGGGSSGPAPANFHAFDKKTGEIIHEMTIDVSPSATPMTYSVDGKQYIAMAFGGGPDSGIVALALP